MVAGYGLCQRTIVPLSAAETKKKEPELSSELAIKAAVYHEMLVRHREWPTNGGQLGAFFLESSPNERTYLQLLFTNWTPRVEVGATNNVQITKSNVIDRVTGKPAKLFWARVVSQTNRMAQAVGGWHFTPSAGGQFSYQLHFNGTNWRVLNKKSDVVW